MTYTNLKQKNMAAELLKEVRTQHSEKPFNLKGREIFVRKAPSKEGIDVSKEYRTSAGSLVFDIVIEFGDLYKDMAGSTIAEADQWKKYQNGDALILANSPEGLIKEEVGHITTEITTLANASSHLNAISVFDYSNDVNRLTEMEKEVVKDEIKGATPIVALRAGMPMTEYLGFKQEDMVLMDAKRLNSLDPEHPNNLALGLRFVGDKDEIMKKLNAANGKFVNADPALATGSTQLGILLWLLSEGVDVKNFTALSIGAAQQGLEMLNDVVEELHQQGNQFGFTTVSAGIYSTLTEGKHPFYIQTTTGDFAVGDGGDFLDLLLPPELRKRWGERISEEQLEELRTLCPQENWTNFCNAGDEITLDLMHKIQHRLLMEYKIEKPVGEIFKQKELENNEP